MFQVYQVPRMSDFHPNKKLYLVKREVYATSIEQALKQKGKVYEVSLAEDKFQPVVEKPIVGFEKVL